MIHCDKCPIEDWCKNRKGVNPQFHTLSPMDIEKYRLCPLIKAIKRLIKDERQSINRRYRKDDKANERLENWGGHGTLVG